MAFSVLLPLSGAVLAGTAAIELILPSVGRAAGDSGSNQRTTLWMHSPATATAAVEIVFLKRQQSNSTPPGTFLSIPHGGAERVANALGRGMLTSR